MAALNMTTFTVIFTILSLLPLFARCRLEEMDLSKIQGRVDNSIVEWLDSRISTQERILKEIGNDLDSNDSIRLLRWACPRISCPPVPQSCRVREYFVFNPEFRIGDTLVTVICQSCTYCLDGLGPQNPRTSARVRRRRELIQSSSYLFSKSDLGVPGPTMLDDSSTGSSSYWNRFKLMDSKSGKTLKTLEGLTLETRKKETGISTEELNLGTFDFNPEKTKSFHQQLAQTSDYIDAIKKVEDINEKYRENLRIYSEMSSRKQNDKGFRADDPQYILLDTLRGFADEENDLKEKAQIKKQEDAKHDKGFLVNKAFRRSKRNSNRRSVQRNLGFLLETEQFNPPCEASSCPASTPPCTVMKVLLIANNGDICGTCRTSCVTSYLDLTT